MKQRVSVRLKFHGCVKGVHDQWIIIMISNHESYNPTIIKIQNGTQIYFLNLDSDVILEFCHIGKPFFVRSIRMKIPIQIILCDIRRIIAAPSTALGLPFDRRLDMFFAANPQDSFIININTVVPVQFIPDSAITHIWMAFMNRLNLFCNLFISLFTATDRIFQPTVISAS
jgi:hypothetical protein